MSFVFFDTETTGLRTAFDQIVHFAAIRTDADLNEIGRFEARSRLLPHVIPHPSALRTNRLSISSLTATTLPTHYEMIGTLRSQLLAWSPAIFVGYNSIRFDEEMLRQALFQTLHSPFLSSNHGNCRADAWGLVMAAAAVAPGCLMVPKDPGGRPLFRLGEIAQSNGIAHDGAHDAMADAIATLSLCRLVRDRASDAWQRFVRFSKKATVADFVQGEDGFVLTEFYANQAFHSPVVCIGQEPGQPNGRLCIRLSSDVEELATLGADELQSALATRPSPVRRLRTNAAPTITPLYDAAPEMLGGLTVDEIETRARRVREDQSLSGRIVSAFVATRKTYAPAHHVEKRIYEDFPSPDDERRMHSFHSAEWHDRVEIVERFDDDKLKLLGRRLIYVERRSALSEAMRLEVERALTDRLVADTSGPLPLPEALVETDKLLDEFGQISLLVDYRGYLVDRISKVSDFRAKHFAA